MALAIALAATLGLAAPRAAFASGVVTNATEVNLRAALAGGGTVTFATSGTIALTDTITIETNTVLDGSGQKLVISGDNSVRVFMVNPNVSLSLKNLTIANGTNSTGGGVFNQMGTVDVLSCTFSNNHAHGSRSPGGNYARGEGGAIFNHLGTTTISGSTFAGNQATHVDEYPPSGEHSWGGALMNSNGTMTVVNSSFVNNLAYTAAGAIYAFGTTAISHCTFAWNPSGSGDTWVQGGPFTLSNSIFTSLDSDRIPASIDAAHNLSGSRSNLLFADLEDNGGPTPTMALLLGSPAIDAADPESYPLTDQRGVSRLFGRACDIGAFEMVVFHPGLFQFEHSSYSFAENTNNAAIRVLRRGGTNGTVLVGLSTSNGTATAGADFAAMEGIVLAFAEGETSKTCFLTVLDDALLEGDESLELVLSHPTGGAELGNVAVASATIRDNESGFVLLVDTASIPEPSGSLSFNVVRTGGSAGPSTVNFMTVNGTAQAGSDFVSTMTVLSFADGETNKPISVQVLDDQAVEGDENFQVRLVDPSPGAVLGTPSSATVTIVDDDFYGEFAFGAESFSVSETGTNALITVLRRNGSAGTATVAFSTSNDTATAGLDYVSNNLTLQFTHGETSKTVPIRVLNDSVAEGPEQLRMYLRSPSPSNGPALGTPSTAVLRIQDDDGNGPCSDAWLRAALAQGGTIRLVADETITLCSSITIATNTVLDASGHRVTISGNGVHRVFTVNPGVTFALTNVTIADGRSTQGAGIYNDGGTLTVVNCVFTNNQAVGTAGADGGPGQAGMDASGGAIHNAGVLVADRCLFITNSATGGRAGEVAPPAVGNGLEGAAGGAGSGGAVCNLASASIDQCYFFQNLAAGGQASIGGFAGAAQSPSAAPAGGKGGNGGAATGGALLHRGSDLILTASTFASNLVRGASGAAGGLSLGTYGGAGGAGGNGGDGVGAGLCVQSGVAKVTNITSAFNHAIGGSGGGGNSGVRYAHPGGNGGQGGSAVGGAVVVRGGEILSLVCATIASNTAVGGGGGGGGLGGAAWPFIGPSGQPGVGGASLGGGIASTGATLRFGNTLLAFNAPGGNAWGNLQDHGFNQSSGAELVLTNLGSVNGAEPKLGPLTSNGGTTPTMALLPGSSAIDGGDTQLSLATDQRGMARPMGLACDVGAFELEQAPVTLGDEVALRAAVSAGGVVSFDVNASFALSSPLVITQAVTLDASEHDVRLDGRGLFRVLHVVPGASLTLRHITVANGRSTHGAGLYNDSGVVALVDCILTNNSAIGLPGATGTNGPQNLSGSRGGNGSPGTPGRGGGIFNTGFLRATNTAFFNNCAQGGDGGAGGRASDGMPLPDGFGRCTFGLPGGNGGYGADGSAGSGGAIYNSGDAVLVGADLRRNHAQGGAGGAGGSSGCGGCGMRGASPGSAAIGGAAFGGAVCNWGRLSLAASLLADNTATGGKGGDGGSSCGYDGPGAGASGGPANGAAVCNFGTNALMNTTLAHNHASGGGSGMDGGWGGGSGHGASGNVGEASGGGVDNAGWLAITNCTIWRNASWQVATQGSPGASYAASLRSRSGSVTELLNTIVGNPASTSNCLGVILDRGHNLASDGSLALTSPDSMEYVDPLLGPLADNGGPTLTMAPAPESLAIDGGDPATCPSTDQRGVARPVGTACDIGAVEGGGVVHLPKLTLSFSPSIVATGTPAALIFTLENPTNFALTGITFSNLLPAELVPVAPVNPRNECGVGSIRVTNGTVIVTNVLLPQFSQCVIALEVASTKLGSYAAFVSTIASDQTGPGPALGGATLQVVGPPSALTGLATNPTATSIALCGTVNPNGLPTTTWFEYGLTPAGGNGTVPQSVGAGHAAHPVFDGMGGLAPGTAYYYRLVSSNRFGVSCGASCAFFTLGIGAGKALGLDGTNDFLATPDLAAFFSNETVTLELWFKAEAAGVLVTEVDQAPLAARWKNSQLEVLNTGEVKGRVWNLAPFSLGTVAFGTWNHAALRYDKAALRGDGFLNGLPSVSSVDGDREAPWESGYEQRYAFGLSESTHLGSGAFFKGQLDEVRVWNVARTEADLRSNMARRLTGQEPGLILYWRLDDGTGSSASDASGHGNVGVLNNGPTWAMSAVPFAAPATATLLTNGYIRITFFAQPGSTCALRALSNWVDWTSLLTKEADTNGLLQWLVSPATRPMRFYKVTLP
ncbi:MAG: hypothetical protein HZA90_00865 [Verrucomicrobia bacterium]|nr:hypothetical protein [Verrucomicrobiota bacterium]